MLTQPKEKYREILTVAENLYRQDPDWVTFFREVVGIDGAVRKSFPSFEELSNFEQSEEFDAIQKMLVKLREKRTSADGDSEPTRVITVRLPKSMHEYLRTEAHDMRTSMNKLCISKLLQVIGEEMIPNERTASNNGSSNNNASSPKPAPAMATSTPIGNQLGTPIGQGKPRLHQPPTPQQPQAPSPFKPAQPRF